MDVQRAQLWAGGPTAAVNPPEAPPEDEGRHSPLSSFFPMSRRTILVLSLLVLSCQGDSDQGASVAPETSRRQAVAAMAPLPPSRFELSTTAQQDLRRQAITSLERGDTDTAVTALIGLSDTDTISETRAVGMLLLAQLYHDSGDLARSLAVLDTLRASTPPSAEFEFVYGNTLIEQGRLADAEVALRRALRINPEFIRAYPTLAGVQASQDRQSDAETTLLAMERSVLNLAVALTESTHRERKLEVIDSLRLSFRHAEVARALTLALDDENDEVVEAALRELDRVATIDVIPALQRLAEGAGPHAERARSLVDSIRASEH